MSMKLRMLLLTISLMSFISPVNAEDGYGAQVMPERGAQPGFVSSGSAGESYGETVGRKLGSGFSNIVLGWLEIPKNVLNTSNNLNVVAGLSLGVIKGVLHTGGRMLTGVADLVSAPLPTKPIVEPGFVWQNFDIETHYGSAFRLKE